MRGILTPATSPRTDITNFPRPSPYPASRSFISTDLLTMSNNNMMSLFPDWEEFEQDLSQFLASSSCSSMHLFFSSDREPTPAASYSSAPSSSSPSNPLVISSSSSSSTPSSSSSSPPHSLSLSSSYSYTPSSSSSPHPLSLPSSYSSTPPSSSSSPPYPLPLPSSSSLSFALSFPPPSYFSSISSTPSASLSPPIPSSPIATINLAHPPTTAGIPSSVAAEENKKRYEPYARQKRNNRLQNMVHTCPGCHQDVQGGQKEWREHIKAHYGLSADDAISNIIREEKCFFPECDKRNSIQLRNMARHICHYHFSTDSRHCDQCGHDYKVSQKGRVHKCDARRRAV
ncbi:hypothetical protein C8Q75DRAFT_510397 [Abortiporus biennis]|nr:hypothetical protein C8Q75DRAFT_510397 [Abortiporus biennis]